MIVRLTHSGVKLEDSRKCVGGEIGFLRIKIDFIKEELFPMKI